jgi:tyrosinase
LHAEERLQKVTNNSKFTYPYWDWTAENNTCSICTNDFMGETNFTHILQPSYLSVSPFNRTSYGISSKHPFSNFKIVCGGKQLCQGKQKNDEILTRAQSLCNYTSLPTKKNVENLLKLENYDLTDKKNNSYNRHTMYSFRNALEGFIDSDGEISLQNNSIGIELFMHNRVHVWTGGVMSIVKIAANDPIFFLHHANIDRIFEKWLQKYPFRNDYDCNVFSGPQKPHGCPICHDFRDNVVPFFPLKTTQRMFHQADYFGYEYDTLLVNNATNNRQE